MQKEVENIFLLSKTNRRKLHGKTMNFDWPNIAFRNTEINAYILFTFLHPYHGQARYALEPKCPKDIHYCKSNEKIENSVSEKVKET
mgnify:CR=1 FL=1